MPYIVDSSQTSCALPQGVAGRATRGRRLCEKEGRGQPRTWSRWAIINNNDNNNKQVGNIESMRSSSDGARGLFTEGMYGSRVFWLY